uniref:Tryptophan synthase alpha chain n=1 Tax=Sonderella linearis TaxID=110477 RepID=A0A1Z1MLK3_9FLOR|nr:Tryptophan synthase alpha subunit [Sonderella linearis]ARW66980.1 Tryptophan synthase alpha subunit [Sonderella linearis]
MNIISKILQEKRKHSTCALIPFITAGYPDIDTTIQILYTLDRDGVDIIELGIPYADALADGPLIQSSSKIALKQGVYINKVLNILEIIDKKLKAPIALFTYYNPILARGIERFIKEISLFNVKGLIIPDLPIEESDYLISLCRIYNIELIFFISPTSSRSRISYILSKAPGCIYLISNTGVTGIRDKLNQDINLLSRYITSKTNKSVMLGFGISNPTQVYDICKWNIDGIVIGSAITYIISEYTMKNDDVVLKKLSKFCQSIKDVLNN